MQNQAVQAYQQAARQTVAPRDLEANLLSTAAAHFQRIRNDWELLASELPVALKFNRRERAQQIIPAKIAFRCHWPKPTGKPTPLPSCPTKTCRRTQRR